VSLLGISLHFTSVTRKLRRLPDPPIKLICSSCDQNARSSDLLRLAPELRMLTWSYTLSGQTIRLAPKEDPPKTVVWFNDYFPLLRVCHQVYSEAAILPYTLNTFSSAHLHHYFNHAGTGLIKLPQHITLRLFSWEWRGQHFPSTHARVFQTIEVVVLRTPPQIMTVRDAIIKRFENQVNSVSATVRYVDKPQDWYQD
jgi:hypothetical protein